MGTQYEWLVKRGVMACLLEQGLLQRDRPGLEVWRETRLMVVATRLSDQLDLVDEAARDVVKAAVEHMALTAYGVGYTATRAYLDSIRTKLRGRGELTVRALWCPLMLPGDMPEDRAAAQLALRESFQAEFGLGAIDPQWSRKGYPTNADFLFWLSASGAEDFLLVQEYSFDMPASLGDFREQGTHLDELMRHRRIVDSRSVFARVASEVDRERFELSEDIKNHLGALTGENKPLYKLCQAASYVERMVELMRTRGVLTTACTAHVPWPSHPT